MDRDALDFRRSAADQPAISEHRPAQNRPAQRRLELRPREASPRSAVQTVALQSILKGAREAIIDFDGAAYRLRITRNHRLILTK